MAHKKNPKKAVAGRPSGIGSLSSELPEARVKVLDAGHEQELNEVDREVIGALTDFRDALRDRAPLEMKYTVRQVVVVVPPPQLGPEDVKKTRQSLGVSQTVFADFLGTSPSTVRSWEQGQKPPSPMARRLLGLIASDPSYWKGQFRSIVQTREDEDETSGTTGTATGTAGERPGREVRPRRGIAIVKKDFKKKVGPKVTT